MALFKSSTSIENPMQGTIPSDYSVRNLLEDCRDGKLQVEEYKIEVMRNSNDMAKQAIELGLIDRRFNLSGMGELVIAGWNITNIQTVFSNDSHSWIKGNSDCVTLILGTLYYQFKANSDQDDSFQYARFLNNLDLIGAIEQVPSRDTCYIAEFVNADAIKLVREELQKQATNNTVNVTAKKFISQASNIGIANQNATM